MNRLFAFVLITSLLYINQVSAQDIRLSDASFLDDNQMPLALPFIGGIRTPQFSTADLNLDGIDDLVLFDRDGSIITPLIRGNNGSLSFDPAYRALFPEIRDWMLLRDYNGDGIKDIFCSPVDISLPGIAVYKGVIRDNELSYELVRFDNTDFDILVVPIGNAMPQIFASIVDLPDIKDLDGDGDLDILSFEPTGFTIHHFRNLSVEEGYGLDTLIYELAESCYGGMIESGFSQEVTLSNSPGECASEMIALPEDLVAHNRHAGSTILSLDITGDDLQEVLLGDVSYNGLVALTNQGTLEEAFFTDQETRFPGIDNAPVEVELFNTAYHEDFDNDGAEELVVAPSDFFGSQSINHVWLYNIDRSEGAGVDFDLQTQNFLVDDMLYPGPNSSPEFWDYNNDGLPDLLVGSCGLSPDGRRRNPAVLLYENVGSPTMPIYELVDPDFGSMRQFNTTSLHFDPSAGDIDGDGDDDVVIGDNAGLLYYLENLSGQQGVVELAPAVFRRWSIKVSAWASPEIFDYNEDGLGDLIIGELNFNSVNGRRGSFTYFENIGSPGSPEFNPIENESPNDPLFGRIDLKDPGSFNNYAAADIVISEKDLLLVTGTSLGQINIYQTLEENPQDSFDTRSLAYGDLYEGRQSKVSLADIDDDDFYEMAIGNRRGGLAIYETDIKVATDVPTLDIATLDEISIVPNPTSDFLEVKTEIDFIDNSDYRLIDASGQIISSGILSSERLDVRSLEQGIYWLHLIKNSEVKYIHRFVKINP